MEKQLTEEKSIAVLLWLKTLNDFKEGEFAESTFNDKFEAFEAVEDTGFSREDYEAGVEFWVMGKVLERNKKTQELSVSIQGKKLFELLEVKGEGVVEEFIKRGIIGMTVGEIVEWVKEHKSEIIEVLGLCISLTDLILTHFA